MNKRDTSIGISIILGISIVLFIGILIVNFLGDGVERTAEFFTEVGEIRTEAKEDQKEDYGCIDGVKEIEYDTFGSVRKVLCRD